METLSLKQAAYEEILTDLGDGWKRQNFVMYSDAMRQIFRRILRQGIDALQRQATRPLGVPQEP